MLLLVVISKPAHCVPSGCRDFRMAQSYSDVMIVVSPEYARYSHGARRSLSSPRTVRRFDGSTFRSKFCTDVNFVRWVYFDSKSEKSNIVCFLVPLWNFVVGRIIWCLNLCICMCE